MIKERAYENHQQQGRQQNPVASLLEISADVLEWFHVRIAAESIFAGILPQNGDLNRFEGGIGPLL